MSVAQDIVAEALTWKGTPFLPEAKLKGIGVDCVGLVVASIEAAGRTVPDSLRYDFGDKLSRMTTALDAIGDRVTDDGEPGDILLYRSPALPHHLAIRLSATRALTAYGPPIGKVIQTPIIPSPAWGDRLYASWRIR